MKKLISKLFGFLLLLTLTTFANSPEKTDLLTVVPLDIFSGTSMITMLVLSSLLGIFFMKNEF